MTDDAPLLVIDTSGDRCLVGLDRGPAGCVEQAEPMQRGHAERLMPMVAALMDRAGLAPRALGAVVVCTGPGGFTGVRVGMAAALGIARGAGVPCCGVDLFAALAHGRGGRVRVVLPAGGRHLFAQTFDDGALVSPPEPVAEDSADPALLGGRLPFEPPAALLAAVARARGLAPGAAPLYLRAPDAEPSRHQPPASLS